MALEESLGHRFQRHELLEQALTHSSQAPRNWRRWALPVVRLAPGASSGDNENLEFLGDAVLGSSPARPCSTASPNSRKGNSRNCALHAGRPAASAGAWPNSSRLDIYMRLGAAKKEKRRAQSRQASSSTHWEAILAALYSRTAGEPWRETLSCARLWSQRLGAYEYWRRATIPVMDFSPRCKKQCRARGGPQPVLRTCVKEEGPEHKEDVTVEVRLPEPAMRQFVGRSQGATTKSEPNRKRRQRSPGVTMASCLTRTLRTRRRTAATAS